MKILATLLLAAGLLGLQADTFEDSEIKLKVDAPKDFTKLDASLGDNEFLGQMKVIFISPDVAESRGSFLVHHMGIPPTFTDYEAMKKGLSSGLGSYLGEAYKEVKVEDVKGDLEGFYLEYQCKGGEQGPDPNGTTPLQVRWYIVKQGKDKYVGFIYMAHQDRWKEFEPKFSESFKTAKIMK